VNTQEQEIVDRALEKLDQWQRSIEAMSPGDQVLVSIAKGAFERFLEQHGTAGRIAVQLAMLSHVINSADPAILQ
jgi:hypothetical protein